VNISIDMPWERNLSVNASHFGPGGHYRRKPDVQGWMNRLRGEVYTANWHLDMGHSGRQVFITVDFRYPDKRVRDAENYFKVIQDAVADGLGLAKRPGMGDENIRISTGSIEVLPKNAGFTIRIEDRQ